MNLTKHEELQLQRLSKKSASYQLRWLESRATIKEQRQQDQELSLKRNRRIREMERV